MTSSLERSKPWPIYIWTSISQNPLEIDCQYQRNTYRKWPVLNFARFDSLVCIVACSRENLTRSHSFRFSLSLPGLLMNSVFIHLCQWLEPPAPLLCPASVTQYPLQQVSVSICVVLSVRSVTSSTSSASVSPTSASTAIIGSRLHCSAGPHCGSGCSRLLSCTNDQQLPLHSLTARQADMIAQNGTWPISNKDNVQPTASAHNGYWASASSS